MKTPAIVDLVTQADAPPLAPVDNVALMFERLAKDPAVDVEKLERLIAMQERILAHNAKAAFEAQFARMQPKIPVIDEQGRIEVKGAVRSTYAPLEDIHDVIKPILSDHGFAMRHRTEWPADKPNIIRIVGILGHEHGHSEESVFEAPMDRSEYRTEIQSMGSTVSYGRRYTTLDLLNISTRRMDKDGAGSQRQQVKAPDGFENWWTDLQAVADNGTAALDKMWEGSKGVFKTHLVHTNRDGWNALKAKAAKVRA